MKKERAPAKLHEFEDYDDLIETGEAYEERKRIVETFDQYLHRIGLSDQSADDAARLKASFRSLVSGVPDQNAPVPHALFKFSPRHLRKATTFNSREKRRAQLQAELVFKRDDGTVSLKVAHQNLTTIHTSSYLLERPGSTIASDEIGIVIPFQKLSSLGNRVHYAKVIGVRLDQSTNSKFWTQGARLNIPTYPIFPAERSDTQSPPGSEQPFNPRVVNAALAYCCPVSPQYRPPASCLTTATISQGQIHAGGPEAVLHLADSRLERVQLNLAISDVSEVRKKLARLDSASAAILESSTAYILRDSKGHYCRLEKPRETFPNIDVLSRVPRWSISLKDNELAQQLLIVANVAQNAKSDLVIQTVGHEKVKFSTTGPGGEYAVEAALNQGACSDPWQMRISPIIFGRLVRARDLAPTITFGAVADRRGLILIEDPPLRAAILVASREQT